MEQQNWTFTRFHTQDVLWTSFPGMRVKEQADLLVYAAPSLGAISKNRSAFVALHAAWNKDDVVWDFHSIDGDTLGTLVARKSDDELVAFVRHLRQSSLEREEYLADLVGKIQHNQLAAKTTPQDSA